MCVVGNLNTVMLAGASGGFALMNYAWMGMGGGVFTWLAGLAVVIMFLVIGFRLFFQVLSVIFKLIFLIIFLPLIIAMTAFKEAWGLVGSALEKSIGMLVSSAVTIIKVTLKVLIIFAVVSFAADENFPGPLDGFNAIFPPLMGVAPENPDAKTMSIIAVFETCERESMDAAGLVQRDPFVQCFRRERARVERMYPGAFDFMSNGWEFLLLMFGLFFLYFYVIERKIEELLGKDGAEDFDYGGWVKEMGTRAWQLPAKIGEIFTKARSAKPKK
jgi:hypothetical protein